MNEFRQPFRLLSVVAAVWVALSDVDVRAQDVSYSVGQEGDLLDAAFYDGFSPDGSWVTSRSVFNVGVNNAGTQAIFWGINQCPCSEGIVNDSQWLYVVDIGAPSSWRRLLGAGNQEYNLTNYDGIGWTPDDSAVFLNQDRYEVATDNYAPAPQLHGYQYYTNSFTRKSEDNWLVADTFTFNPANELVMLPVLADGTEDPSREPVIITNLQLSSGFGEPLIFPSVSPDGTAVAFCVWESATSPDTWDIYVLENVDDIINAPKIASSDISSLAPTSLADPNIVDFRASETDNPATIPRFSQDGTLIFYSEDYNNVLETDELYDSIANGNWDINLANRDGTGDIRFQLPLNQGSVIPFPTGTRFTFIRAPIGGTVAKLYAGTLTVNNDVSSSANTLPEGGTTAVIDGNVVTLPFTLTDSAVQIAAPTTVSDASGTEIDLPVDQVINFPDGTVDPVLTIVTPIDPVASHELPDFATQIPVIRTFGPAGTQFEPPITVTFSYSDAEVADIADESQMIPYLYNTMTEEFEPLDAQFLATVVVDVDANTLTFQTDHFSTYGIGFSVLIAPGRPWAVYGLGVLIAMLAALAMRTRARVKPNARGLR